MQSKKSTTLIVLFRRKMRKVYRAFWVLQEFFLFWNQCFISRNNFLRKTIEGKNRYIKIFLFALKVKF
jgi:hypothetical protein